jgi:hypothetical protein
MFAWAPDCGRKWQFALAVKLKVDSAALEKNLDNAE